MILRSRASQNRIAYLCLDFYPAVSSWLSTTCILVYKYVYLFNFLRSPRRKWEFQLAIAQVWNSENNVIVVFKENLNPEHLDTVPELKALWETNLCIKASKNKAELIDRIR